MTLYALVNESTAPELTPKAIETMAAILQLAFNTDFAPAWEISPSYIGTGPPVGKSNVLHLVDTIPEAPDALAYHTVDAVGRSVLRLGVETIRGEGGGLLDEISVAASHEIFETACNRYVALYCLIPGDSRKLAYEVCDPVQGSRYVRNGTAISNFVLPAYFDAEDPVGPYDHLGTLTAPLSCAPHGYQAFDDGTMLFGADVSDAKRACVRAYGRLASR